MQSILLKITLSATLVSLLSAISSCNSGAGNKTKEDDPLASLTTASTPKVFERLLGTWKNTSNDEFERWTKNADGSFQSVVFHIKNGDTLFTERANVYQDDSTWTFENVVKDQNAGKAVKFPATVIGETNVHFSNPAHDFPTEINYSVPNDTTVNAFIAGGQDTVLFNYRRERL
jgi:Domain of unknown function (DUF6265)